MHKAPVNGLGGLNLSRKSVDRLIDHPDMTIVVYRGHLTTTQHKATREKEMLAQLRWVEFQGKRLGHFCFVLLF